MNKKNLLLLIFILLCIPFISAYSQDEGLFFDLNGRSKQWVEHNYPDFKINPNFGESFDGYYRLETLRCRDGGYIILMVGFDGYQHPNEVGTVSLYSKGCKEYIPNEDFSEAINFFIQMFGLTKYIEDAKVFLNEPNNILVSFPNLITFSAHKRYNSQSNFYYFYSSCSQLYPSK